MLEHTETDNLTLVTKIDKTNIELSKAAIHIGFLDNNAIHAISPLLDNRIAIKKAVYLYEAQMADRLSAFCTSCG